MVKTQWFGQDCCICGIFVTTCLFAESKGLGNPGAVDEGWGAPSMKSQNRYTPSKTNMEPSKNGVWRFFSFPSGLLLGSWFGPSTGSTGERSVTWKLTVLIHYGFEMEKICWRAMSSELVLLGSLIASWQCHFVVSSNRPGLAQK